MIREEWIKKIRTAGQFLDSARVVHVVNVEEIISQTKTQVRKETIKECADLQKKLDNVFEQAIQPYVNKKVMEAKKETLKEILMEFHSNRMDGKGYDFFFAISDKLDNLSTLSKEQYENK